MAKKIKGWKGKLKASERKHLSECGITTKYSMQKQIEFMKKEDARDIEPTLKIICWDCKHIAIKLGMWK